MCGVCVAIKRLVRNLISEAVSQKSDKAIPCQPCQKSDNPVLQKSVE